MSSCDFPRAAVAVICFVGLFCVFPAAEGLSEAISRPHIIFILADDLGFNDVSFRGGNAIPTPNIDSLAFSGIILGNYYVQPTCTPSRAALLTGRYPLHTGMQDYVIVNGQPWGLSPDVTLLPQLLGKLGYESHIVGKWHLGFHCESYLPTRRGFASHFGYWGSHEDFYNHSSPDGANYPIGFDFRRNMDDVSRAYQGQYATDIFVEESSRIIREHDKTKPLFLYLPHLAPHAAPHELLQAPEDLIERFAYIKDPKRQKYAAMLTKLDQAVGRLIRDLDDHGMLENSVIIFSSDNGGTRSAYEGNAGSNYPLRGEKFTPFEGGTRAAGLVWSNSLKVRSRVANQLMHLTDWVPSLWAVAGGSGEELPADLDGINLWKELSEDRPSPRKDLVYNMANDTESTHGTYGAVRLGDLKLIQGWINFSEPLDDWYGDTNQLNASSEDLNLVQETLAYLEEHNIVGQVFGSKGYLPPPHVRDALRKEATITCEDQPEAKCEPQLHPCIFNVTRDPCERNNLFDPSRPDEMGEKYRELFVLYDEYLASLVKRRNRPYDPASSPKHHENLWVPWLGKCGASAARMPLATAVLPLLLLSLPRKSFELANP